MMEVTLTCSECGSGIHIHPDVDAHKAICDVCSNEMNVTFDENHAKGILKDCPCCQRKDFYSQKDFNRKIGVALFVIAAILSIWTYGISFIVLYALDLFLFRKLAKVAICYKCNTIFRNLTNMEELYGFNHEMNDRIVYSDHDFGGEQLEHH
ncbi:hypothetical protein [Halobacteriovorax sp. HLS]|uniref:hypothetical protein n=1 Tax=Halobacteriovorax sp. HLS TaxID=2234000 RepID=UPI000FD997EB|nr:hypothetical protein [Halobacteriovorax sp. HLS]